MTKIKLKQTEIITTSVFQLILDSKFRILKVNYMFIFSYSFYIITSLSQQIPFLEAYSNVDFLQIVLIIKYSFNTFGLFPLHS